MPQDTEDINERVKREWSESTDGFERVRDVIRNSRDKMKAKQVAETADVSPNTARKYLGRLHEMNEVQIDERGGAKLYRWDESSEKMRRVRNISSSYSRDEIEDRIREMRSEIHEYREEYGVETPEDLIIQMDERENEGEMDIPTVVSEWRTKRENLAIAKTALAFKQVLTFSDEGTDTERTQSTA
ncbi:hypothetical protein ACEU6E_05400 [Halorutilales archaeon Cl-col2-1]